MRTFTGSVIILSAEIVANKITGMAIDGHGDIAIKFAVANTDVNERLFVPEAQLVVSGKFRIAQEIATIGAWIDKVIAVISIPAPEIVVPESEIITPSPEVAASEPEVVAPAKLTSVQKRAATIAAKKAALAVA